MSTTGFYGKIPLRGDFVYGRVPTTFKNAWDDWAQQLVSASEKIKLADQGQCPWLRLPVYRFYLSENVAGENAWTGIMLASRDSVGRQFPFCLVRDIAATVSAPVALSQQESFLEAVESLIEQLYAGQLEFESLEPALAEIDARFSAENSTSDTTAQMTHQSSGDSMNIRIGASASLEDNHFWKTAATAILNTNCTSHSIWTTSPLSNSPAETLICEAMPTPQACLSMFTGEFTGTHWTSVTGDESPDVQRGENSFAQAHLLQSPVPITPAQVPVDDGDTKPINKIDAATTPQKTDFLEFDEIDDSDAPWDT